MPSGMRPKYRLTVGILPRAKALGWSAIDGPQHRSISSIPRLQPTFSWRRPSPVLYGSGATEVPAVNKPRTACSYVLSQSPETLLLNCPALFFPFREFIDGTKKNYCPPSRTASLRLVTFAYARLCFDLNIYAARQIQLRQRIHCPRRAGIDVQ